MPPKCVPQWRRKSSWFSGTQIISDPLRGLCKIFGQCHCVLVANTNCVLGATRQQCRRQDIFFHSRYISGNQEANPPCVPVVPDGYPIRQKDCFVFIGLRVNVAWRNKLLHCKSLIQISRALFGKQIFQIFNVPTFLIFLPTFVISFTIPQR